MAERDVVEVVNRRVDVLGALDEPRQKRDLLADFDVSRSTLDRAVRELDTLGLVARDEGYYRTVAGQLVLELFREFRSDLGDVVAARELLRGWPRDVPMSPAMLRGARVEVAEPPSPARALEPVLDVFDRAERIRGFSMAETNPAFFERTRELLRSGTEIAVVYDPALAEYLADDDRPFERFVGTESFEPYVHPDLPYGLGVVTAPDGETAFVTCYDDERAVRGVIINDSPAACRWATDVFERYRGEADPLEL